MKRSIPLLAILPVIFLVACNPTGSVTENASPVTPANLPTTETASATPTYPPATEVASPTPTNLPATGTPTPHPEVPIVYYYFVAIEGNTFPAGSVVILPDILVLGPALSKIDRSLDTITNISSALQAMLGDPRNAWTSTDLSITSITFKEGAANVVLQGDFFAPGDIVLIAARYQILMTVFAEASVETATITINGKNIANLGNSDSFGSQPDDYMYTRAEIETFMAENAYPGP